MSAVNQEEILASFRVLVAMAQADGKLLDQERQSLLEAFSEIHLAQETLSIEDLLQEEHDINQLLSQIQSETARQLVYQSAHMMAYVDGECSPEEQALLSQIGGTITQSQLWGKADWLKKLEESNYQATIGERMRTLTQTQSRTDVISDLIVDMSLMNAVLGAFPVPLVAIAFDLLIYWNQLDLAQAIGEQWGYRRTREDLKQAFMKSIGFSGLRIATSNLAKLIPYLGMAYGGATAYGTTWAIGKVSNQYFAGGGTMDAQALRDTFKAAKQEGARQYEEQTEVIAAKQAELSPKIQTLQEGLQRGELTESEYLERLKQIL
ncbi:MAG: hypothetical protein HC919_10060 [Oscillatoriales cyanobacterium SM2_2_1]|nr:hypothetical protein [Oscillatoriales cyanobacterium SM2_2_1]